MDNFDKRILHILQREGRIKNNQLAEKIGLSAAPCLRRTRALERRGVIERYSAIINPEKIGFSLIIFANVKLKNQERDNTQYFESEIMKYDNVIECNFMTGSHDYLLKIASKDIASYENFLMSKLTKLSCIQSIESFVSMRTVKNSALVAI